MSETTEYNTHYRHKRVRECQLQVEHTLLQRRANAVAPDPVRLAEDILFRQVMRSVRIVIAGGKQLVDIASTPLASEIGVISRWDEADCPRCASEHVGGGVREALNGVGVEIVLVMDDVIVCGSSRPLQSTVSLEEEVEIVNGSDATVDYGAGTRIAIPIGAHRVDRVETSMVPLSSDALR